MDDTTAPRSAGGSSLRSPPVGRLQSSAFATFRNADSRGQAGLPGATSASGESELLTVHQNSITSVRAFDGSRETVRRVSTSGLDGKLVIWSVSAAVPAHGLAGRIGNMRI